MDVRKLSLKLAREIHQEIGTLGCTVLAIIVIFILIAMIGMYPVVFLFLGICFGSYMLGFEMARNKYKRYLRQQDQREPKSAD